MTHTKEGTPIVLENIADSVLNFPVGNMDGFVEASNEFWDRLEQDNPALAKVIFCQVSAIRQFAGDQAAVYFMDSMYQVLSILEQSEEHYRRG